MLPSDTAGHPLVDGSATAPIKVLDEPLSLWGGFDPLTGTITDVHHPNHGETIAGTIVVMTSGRGSSSASSVLVEAIRLGTAPAGFVLTEADEILVLGAVVGHELYDMKTPIMVVPAALHERLVDGQPVTIEPGGRIVSG